jgi:DNA-binding transcriptional MerR regulator
MLKNEPAHSLSDWPGGGIQELAAEAARVLDAMGRHDDTLASAKDLGKRIRVIRDYARRGILSDAPRRGKELFYDAAHLRELVAARLLAADGLSLSAIAAQWQSDPDVILMTLGMLPADNKALATWQSMQVRDKGPALRSAPAEASRTYFMRSAGATRGRGVRLRELLTRLGSPARFPKLSDTVRIDVTDWCTVLIDKHKLQDLSGSESDDLAGAISASLLKARAGK